MISHIIVPRNRSNLGGGEEETVVSVFDSGVVRISNTKNAPILFRRNFLTSCNENGEHKILLEGVSDATATRRQYGFILFSDGYESEAICVSFPVSRSENEIGAVLSDYEKQEIFLGGLYESGDAHAFIAYLRTLVA